MPWKWGNTLGTSNFIRTISKAIEALRIVRFGLSHSESFRSIRTHSESLRTIPFRSSEFILNLNHSEIFSDSLNGSVVDRQIMKPLSAELAE